MRHDAGVRPRLAGATAGAAVAVSPDRHHWWDGSTWQAAPWPVGAVTVTPQWDGWDWQWPGPAARDLALSAMIERLARAAVAIEVVLAWIGALAMTTTPQGAATHGAGNFLAGGMLLSAGGGALACMALIWRRPLLPPPSLVLAGVAWVALGWLVGFADGITLPAVVGWIAFTCTVMARATPRARATLAAPPPKVGPPLSVSPEAARPTVLSPWVIGLVAGIGAAGFVIALLVLLAGGV